MPPRPYRMTRRGESAEQTRRRIVEATFALHGERGIAATSHRDIARRADVGVGTVYHHFPNCDDVIEACGEYTLLVTRPPGPEVLAGSCTPAERLHAVVAAVFDFYRRFPGYERVRADRDRFPQVDRFVRADERKRARLLSAALAPAKPARARLTVALAALDCAVYRLLTGRGLSHRGAVKQATALLQRWLLEAAARPVPTHTGGAKRASAKP